jgi:NADH dehydrogenase (ubiquinone) 1 alpha subcomplex subunit 9
LYVNADSSSGVNMHVVVFGGNSQLAPTIATNIAALGARFTYPVRTSSKWVDHLKPITNFRQTYIPQYLDFNDPDIIPRLIQGNHIVINLIGGNSYIKDYDLLYEANVTLAKRIAEACAASADVKRLIHFSAVGADPHSPSTRLQTKWLGEQEVLNAYPSATIMRPCTIFGDIDNFLIKLGTMQQMFDFIPVIDDATELRQPIYYQDIGKAVMNALRLPESAGQTYELGGPHVYPYIEIIEMMYNKIHKLPKVKSFPYSKAHKFLRWLPHHHGTTRWMSLNDVQESKIDLVVRPQAKTIEDLFVQPLSLGQMMKYILTDYVSKVDTTTDEFEHGWHTGHDRHYEP